MTALCGSGIGEAESRGTRSQAACACHSLPLLFLRRTSEQIVLPVLGAIAPDGEDKTRTVTDW